ncbi:MAG: ECF transporter S component [Bacilli bacterium]|nr:ECF transporter S component [Bacilli bacterium]
MDVYNLIALIVGGLLILGSARLYGYFFPNKEFSPVRMISRIAVFGAMSSILYLVPVFKLRLPFFPSFLELHFDEIPAFIAGFAYGPLTGIGVIAIKTALKFAIYGVTETMGVGELMDLILSVLYVGIATFVYSKRRNLVGVAIGFSIGTVVQVLAAMVLNVYVMIPFYMNVKGYPLDALLRVMQIANPAITDVGWSYAFFAVLPFNLVKDAIVIVLTFLLYRSLHVWLRFDKKKKPV